MSRLKERSHGRLDQVRRMRWAMLFTVAAVVVIGLGLSLTSTYFLLTNYTGGWRIAQVLLSIVSTVVDVFIVFLAWVLFDAITRIEREAERLQAFMDNVYRRIP